MVVSKKVQKKPSLLDYQVRPIEKLVSKCKSQHGMILYHVMGSGKTISSIYLAKNYPNKKLVILLPDGLQNIWIRTANPVGQKIDKIITYESLLKYPFKDWIKLFTETLKDSILIADEAHNLINIIKTLFNDDSGNVGVEEDVSSSTSHKYQDKKQRAKNGKIKEDTKTNLYEFLDAFKGAYKVLLLTGTPIINGLPDIRWLVNIAAGKRILPYNEHEFVKQFYKTDIVDAFLLGWVNEIMAVTILGLPIISNSNWVNLNNIEGYVSKIRGLIDSYFQKEIGGEVSPDENNRSWFWIIKKLITKEPTSDIKDLVVFKPNDSSLVWIFRKLFSKDPSNAEKLFIRLIVTSIALSGLYMLYNYLSKNYSRYNYKKLDPTKFSIAKPYIDYYTITNNDPNYPKVTFKTESVGYTQYQLELWTRLIYYVNISDSESVLLELNKNINEAELFKPNYVTSSVYLDKGRIIGNLNEIDNTVSNKKDILYPFRNQIPLKFISIAESYIRNKTSTVVYSNFYEHGIVLLSKYLKKRGINHVVYTPTLSVNRRNKILLDFKNKKITLILLHPAFFEGFSINGVRVFHILEPLLEYYKIEQLITRGVRYQSHFHLPLKERTVKIVQWECSLKPFFSQIKRFKESIKNWVQNDLAVVYFSRFADYNSYLTPDTSVNSSVNKTESYIKTFSSNFKNNSESNLKNTCCIYSKTCSKLKSCISKN